MALSEARAWPSVYDAGVPRWELRGQAISFGLWLAITGIAAYLKPNPVGHGTHQYLGLPPCPSVLMFDRPCPGCGLTTSWTALVHGDFAFAFHAHPLGPILYGIFTAVALLGGYGFLTGQRLRTYTDKVTRLTGIDAAAFVIFGVARFALMPHFAAKYERALFEASKQP